MQDTTLIVAMSALVPSSASVASLRGADSSHRGPRLGRETVKTASGAELSNALDSFKEVTGYRGSVCRQPGGDAIYIPSKEGFAQGDPLAMVLYGSGLLPLANILRIKFPDLLQPWYADDAAVQGTPAKVAAYFALSVNLGPMFGCLPEPKKSFAISPS